MASTQSIEIKVNQELIEYIKWLQSYKNVADEALTILTTVNLEDNEHQLVNAVSLALRALSIGAHEQPSIGWGEQDVIVRLFLMAWRQDDFETYDKLPDWIEMEKEQFIDVLHRFAYLLTEQNSKTGAV